MKKPRNTDTSSHTLHFWAKLPENGDIEYTISIGRPEPEHRTAARIGKANVSKAIDPPPADLVQHATPNGRRCSDATNGAPHTALPAEPVQHPQRARKTWNLARIGNFLLTIFARIFAGLVVDIVGVLMGQKVTPLDVSAPSTTNRDIGGPAHEEPELNFPPYQGGKEGGEGRR